MSDIEVTDPVHGLLLAAAHLWPDSDDPLADEVEFAAAAAAAYQEMRS